MSIPYAHGRAAPNRRLTICAISITNDIAGRFTPAASFCQLAIASVALPRLELSSLSNRSDERREIEDVILPNPPKPMLAHEFDAWVMLMHRG
jgi:hypothetical protein